MSKINVQELQSSIPISANPYFKQFQVCDTIQFPCHNCKYIDSVSSKLKISEAKFINTVKETSLEGQHLSGKKLVLLGTVDVSATINCKKCNSGFCTKTKKIPFSTFIVVPNDICDEKIINVSYLIEDTSYAIYTCDALIISTTIYIQYNDQYLV